MAYFQLSKTSVRLAHPLVFTLSAAEWVDPKPKWNTEKVKRDWSPRLTNTELIYLQSWNPTPASVSEQQQHTKLQTPRAEPAQSSSLNLEKITQICVGAQFPLDRLHSVHVGFDLTSKNNKTRTRGGGRIQLLYTTKGSFHDIITQVSVCMQHFNLWFITFCKQVYFRELFI